jgi:branched-chain amino acid transport system permease protein
MTPVIQQVIDGVVWGSLYGALALSLALVYRASGIINFAQGAMAVSAAFVTWQVHAWGVPIVLALVAAVLFGAFLGWLIEATLVRRMAQKRDELQVVILTLGVMLMLQGLIGLIWGYDVRQVARVVELETVRFNGLVISGNGIALVAAVALMSVVLYVWLQRTRSGLVVRASGMNPESSRLLGIRVNARSTLLWSVAAAVGAVTATLAAPVLYLRPDMLTSVLIYSMAAAILGGLGSPSGAIIGGLIVGVAENLAGSYVPGIGSDFKQTAAFLIIMGVLLIRPHGLFGDREVARL